MSDSQPWGWRAAGWGLLALLLVRFVLGAAFLGAAPLWESYDEEGHFAYARYLAVHGRVTLDTTDPEAATIWERFQPPLYYNLLALPLRLFDLRTFALPEQNPYFVFGDAGLNRAVPVVNPTPAQQAVRQAAWAGRWLTLGFSVLSLLPMFYLARRLWPAEPATAWFATAVYALWPQYLFLGSMMTNDALVTALATVVLWLVVQLLTGGFKLRWALLLALSVGAAMLTKINALALVPVVVLALAVSFFRVSQNVAARWGWHKNLVSVGVLVACVGLALGGLFSLQFVTEQVLQVETLKLLLANSVRPGAGALVGAAVQYGFRTFWASFGWGNVETAAWTYDAWTLGLVAALVGGGVTLVHWVREGAAGWAERHKLLALLLLGYVVLAAGLALSLVVAHDNVFLLPGRYLLPTLPAVVLLLVMGWHALIPAAWRPQAWFVLSAAWLVLVAWMPWDLAQIYRWPTPLPAATPTPGIASATQFGDEIVLLSYVVPTVRPGATVNVQLCWQAARSITQNYTLELTLVGADGQGYGRYVTYPGRGNYPTRNWVVGQRFCESYAVAAQAAIPAPGVGSVRVRWLGPQGEEPALMPYQMPDRQPLDEAAMYFPLQITQDPTQVPAAAVPVRYRFGEGLWLTGYTLEPLPDGTGTQVTLRWEVEKPLGDDYVVFVHLRDTPAHAWSVGDSIPRAGAYPTHWWQPGEVILDPHHLPYPPEAGQPYPPMNLYVGLYQPLAAKRLPAFDGVGTALLNGEVLLGEGVHIP